MVTEKYPYRTEEEKLTIWNFLNALYGHLYCSGYGNIKIDRENKIIYTNLLLKEQQILTEGLKMGYESRVFVVNRNEIKRKDGMSYIWGEKIADVKMSCMYDGFTDLFDKEVDYELYIDNEDESTKTDKYGAIMTYTDCKTVIDYLEKLIANGENYRRLTVLLGLLKGIDESQWDEIQVVHYGY